MDLATLIGFLAGIIAIVWSIWSSAGLNGLLAFVDVPSIIIVIGGALSATLISYPLSQVLSIFSIASQVFKQKKSSSYELIDRFLDLNKIVRKEGLLALEREIQYEDDDFFKKSIRMAVDGMPTETIKSTLENDIDYFRLRNAQSQGIFETLSAQFPAWGMIGTLIGLVLMLKNLNDPNSIGPSMAIAIITTFYGSVLSNLICNPIAKKLEIRCTEEVIRRALIVEGVVSLAENLNPLVIEQKLNSFLANSQKKEIETYGR